MSIQPVRKEWCDVQPPPPWAVKLFHNIAIVVRVISTILGACLIAYVALIGLLFLAIFISYPVVFGGLLAAALIGLRLLFRG